jgi:hypothetical protein
VKTVDVIKDEGQGNNEDNKRHGKKWEWPD